MAATVQIPGGEAVLSSSRAEMTPRRLREVELLQSRLGKKITSAVGASMITCEGDVVVDNRDELDEDGTPKFTADPVDVSPRELRLMTELTDAWTWALLRSWTLPEPLPATPDDILDLSIDVFNALRFEASRIVVDMMAEPGFTVDSVEDRNSPTGDSGA
jgi:hypothetical protein